jgi:hypothetical protein
MSFGAVKEDEPASGSVVRALIFDAAIPDRRGVHFCDERRDVRVFGARSRGWSWSVRRPRSVIMSRRARRSRCCPARARGEYDDRQRKPVREEPHDGEEDSERNDRGHTATGRENRAFAVVERIRTPDASRAMNGDLRANDDLDRE